MKRAVALGALLFLSPTAALANGRFPASNQVARTSADPDLVVVRATFGILVSRDAGKTFDWVCETAVGYSGTQDPGIAVTADGSLVVAAFEGLSVSHDGGCTWAFEKGPGLAGEYVIDVAAEAQQPKSAVVVTSTGLGLNDFHVQVFRTDDDAKTWTATGPALDNDILAETLDVAPSDPKRIYVSGETGQGKDRKGVLATSQDGGVTWKRREVELGTDQQLFIAAVDPKDADRVYLRTVGPTDRLIVSKDGGDTFESVLTVTRPLSGFAASPDGDFVVLGGPDVGWPPGEKPLDAIDRKPQLLRAKTSDLAFAPLGARSASCLTWDASGLFACGESFTDGFVVGRSTGDDGFSPLLPKLSDIKGPIACPAASPAAKMCAPMWPAFVAQFGGTAGAGGAAGASGTGAASGAAPTDGDGCGCATPPGGSGGLAGVALGLAALAKTRRKGVTRARNAGTLKRPSR